MNDPIVTTPTQTPLPFQVTKRFSGYSTAHRLWKATSHCRFIHGYDRSFDVTFGCTELDANGWVVDFGGLKQVHKNIEDKFDHKTVIASDDPLMSEFLLLERMGGCELTVMPHPGMEGAAEWVAAMITLWIRTQPATAERVYVVKVVARENDKNAVVYQCG